MYVNKIDEIINKILDDYYNFLITKLQNTILGESNFVKYQKDINNLMSTYNKSIDITEIKNIIKNDDNIYTINEMIKRYMAFYLFLYIGVFYKDKNSIFINNIIEFTKNQSEYQYKIDNFFNSDNNALLINYNNLIKSIYIILDSDIKKINKRKDLEKGREFLDNMDEQIINDYFKIKDQSLRAHNIIKNIIILKLYRENDRKNMFKMIETSVENEEGEYLYIDIVIPQKEYIDFTVVEEVLGIREIKNKLVDEIWNYIIDHDHVRIKKDNINNKILTLLNSKLLIPIVDDFLLYHKDDERYDKTENNEVKVNFYNKNKDDTKIKYIVNKIDNVSLYYSQFRKLPQAEIKKLFYIPYIDRKVVLINNNEEMKIIDKLLKQGKNAIESNEFIMDLIQYRIYPYINFKDFEYNGFSITLNKTIDIVRKISFDKQGDFKQNNNNNIQFRTGANDHIINIVGFMIPTNINSLGCLKVSDVMNIRDIGIANKHKENNGYNLLLNYIKESNFNNKKHKTSLYWLFDPRVDIVKYKTYEQQSSLINQEQCKLMINQLYDDLMIEYYNYIIKKLNNYEDGTLEINDGFKILYNIEKKLFRISNDDESTLYANLESIIIYNKSPKIEVEYDEKEDVFHGIGENIIKLENAPQQKNPKIYTIVIDTYNLYETKNDKQIKDVEITNAVCQHNITWENITYLRTHNPNVYTDKLYEFVQQYVDENLDGEFICKSCGTLLNIKKYIIDGEFDNDTQRFVTYVMPLEIALESMHDYSQYYIAIRNMDRIIEKIATIVHIPYLVGSNMGVKEKRKPIIKNAIDIINYNNKMLKKDYVERNKIADKLYGISRNLSDLYIFDFENSIFVYSTKDKDYYKNKKYNNILSYIIILMIIDLNEGQIAYMTGDKLCSYTIFDKYGYILFEGLKIRINKGGDLDDIKNYKVLCYILYIISCMISKYNIWHVSYDDTDLQPAPKPLEKNKKKINPMVQKSIIQTFVDILNSIIENSTKPNVYYIYEIITTKYFNRLINIFNNKSIIGRFVETDIKGIATEKKTYITTTLNDSSLFHLNGYTKIDKWCKAPFTKCIPFKYYINNKHISLPIYYDPNNITNCPTGQFHEWNSFGQSNWNKVEKTLVCKICGTKLIDIIYSKQLSEEIIKRSKNVRYNNLLNKICLDPENRNEKFCLTIMNPALKNLHDQSNFSNFITFLEKKSKEKNNNIDEKMKKNEIDYKNEEINNKNIYNQLLEKYKKDTKENKYYYINTLINNIQNIMGSDIHIGDNYVNLNNNIYIIEYDQKGMLLPKPLIISEKDHKIFLKKNHSYFKKDVYYYNIFTNVKTEIFYDAETLLLLGYKENNKDYVLFKKKDIKMKIKYSLFEKIKMLGYQNRFIDIKYKIDSLKKDDEYINHNNDDKYDVINTIIENFIRDRINNITKIINEFKRVIFKIKNKYMVNETKNNEINKNNDIVENKIEQLTEKYFKKISDIKIRDISKEHKIFKYWKQIIQGIPILEENKPELKKDYNINNIINIDDINIIQSNSNVEFGNLLLNYFIDELTKLIHYNSDNNNIKENLIEFIIEFIDIMFNMFNDEMIFSIEDIKRFYLSLRSSMYIQDLENTISEFTELVGIYDDYKDPQDIETEETYEEKEDDKEEADAIDMDIDEETDIDAIYEDAYARSFENRNEHIIYTSNQINNIFGNIDKETEPIYGNNRFVDSS